MLKKFYYTYKLKKLLREVCYLVEVKKKVSEYYAKNLIEDIQFTLTALDKKEEFKKCLMVQCHNGVSLFYWVSKRKGKKVRKFCGYKSIRIKNLRGRK